MAGEVATGPGGAIAAGVGSIASNFAEGYRQARLQAFQQQMGQQDMQFKHAQGLMEASDHVPDPVMAQTMRSQAASIFQNMPPAPGQKGGKSQNNFGSLGHAFMNLLGIGGAPGSGGQGAGTATPAGAGTPPQLPEPPAPSSAPPLSADSRTFGSPGGMAPFASSLPPVPPPIQTTAGADLGLPEPPPVPNVPPVAAKSTPNPAAVPITPTPLGPMPAQAPTPLPGIGPAAGSSVISGENGQPIPMHPAGPQFQLPTANDLVNHYLNETRTPKDANGNPTGPPTKYGTTQSDSLAQRGAQMEAKTHTDAVLDAVDQIVRQDPTGRFATLAQAEADPEHGDELRHAMSAVGDYENSGLLPKGTLENWQKQRFNDVRFGSVKYGEHPIATGADGNHYAFNAARGQYDTLVGGPSYESQINGIYSKPPSTWTQGEKDAVAGHNAQLQNKDRAAWTPTEEMQDSYFKQLQSPRIAGGQGLSSTQAYERYLAQVRPPAPVQMLPSQDNQGNNVYTGKRADGSTFATDVRMPNTGTFNPAEYMTKETIINRPNPLSKPGHPLPDTPTMVMGLDAGKLVTAHAAGDRRITIPALQQILNSGVAMNPEDRQVLQKYIDAQTPPSSLTQPPKPPGQ